MPCTEILPLERKIEWMSFQKYFRKYFLGMLPTDPSTHPPTHPECAHHPTDIWFACRAGFNLRGILEKKFKTYILSYKLVVFLEKNLLVTNDKTISPYNFPTQERSLSVHIMYLDNLDQQCWPCCVDSMHHKHMPHRNNTFHPSFSSSLA